MSVSNLPICFFFLIIIFLIVNTSYRRWEIKIEGCKDASFFRIIIGIALTLQIIVFIISTSLLLYRKIRCNSVIWNGQCFTALDGFLFWADIWCIGRIIFIIDQL